MDLGTGDGRGVLDRAIAEPDRLVIGVDANASGMAEASRRAARRQLPNAIFLAADALSLPDELAGFADLVTIHFPWGSLLHAAAHADPRLVCLLAPGGRMRLLVSASAADASAGLTELDAEVLAGAYRRGGLRVVTTRAASLEDANRARSSWGKRLLRNPMPGRDAWLLEADAGADAASIAG
jgi:16S rRNA (adenine(1408)-N(1))-methyltransferase